MRTIFLVTLSLTLLCIARCAIAAKQPPVHVVLAINENEYHATQTLPAFAREELEKTLGWKVTVLQSDDPKNLPNTEALESADLLILYLRRTTLPDEQLNRFKAYFEAGKPVIALRTSSHGFQNWLEFDKQVLGGNYQKHYGKDGGTRVTPAPAAADHPIFRGLTPTTFTSTSWLYKTTPLADSATPLLLGQYGDEPKEPIAWTNTHKSARIFYTSLGHPDDFALPQFRQLLRNAAVWVMEKPDRE